MISALPDPKYKEILRAVKQALGEGIHPSLELITALNLELGEPDSSFSSIQVTGTNGKSSTTYLIANLLAAEGFAVGRFTSPELIRSNERIATSRIGDSVIGKPEAEKLLVDISDDELFSILDEVLKASERLSQKLSKIDSQPFTPSEFELITAAALLYFNQKQLDFAVLEVGLGGRWDSTSVVLPSVSVVTGVGLDHMEFLGPTLQDIAFDKAHIIKQGGVAILGDGFDEVLPVFLERAKSCGVHPRLVRSRELGAYADEELSITYEVFAEELSVNKKAHSLVRSSFEINTPHGCYKELQIPAPSYQVRNAALALAAAESALGRALNKDAVRHAFENFYIPARFELIDTEPVTIFDGSHNPQAIEHLSAQLKALGLRPIIAFGGFKDKQIDEMIKILAPSAAGWAAIQPDPVKYNERALPADEMAARIEKLTGFKPLSVQEHFDLFELQQQARNATAPLLVAGSLSMYHLVESLR